jgi:hypothetical protein
VNEKEVRMIYREVEKKKANDALFSANLLTFMEINRAGEKL